MTTVEKEVSSVEKETTNKLITTTAMLLTHAYAHLLVDMHLAAFAPAFTVSLCDSEAPANRRMRIASVVSTNCKKKENRPVTLNNSLYINI